MGCAAALPTLAAQPAPSLCGARVERRLAERSILIVPAESALLRTYRLRPDEIFRLFRIPFDSITRARKAANDW